MHDNWTVEKNHVADSGFVGIELTNVEESKIVKNSVDDSFFHGILVQARNTIGSSESPVVSGIEVIGNNVHGTVLRDGIRLLAFEGLTGSPFTSVGGTAEISGDCEVTKNNVQNNLRGIRLQAFNVGATIMDCVVENNNVQDNTGSGITLLATGGTTDSNEVLRNRISNNSGDGIFVEGDINSIDNNKTSNNGGDGIKVTGSGNDIDGNKAMDNTVDGIDCVAGNTESGNTTKNNGGTDNTGCV